jgi:adenine-specific DNA-methyltransferase
LPLQFPKPVNLIKQLIQAGTISSEDIILDLFAGSCTTAQAVLELNREEDKNRRFIMVQLPEASDNSEFPTIAEIGKERIRRVIAKMKKKNYGGPICLDSFGSKIRQNTSIRENSSYLLV